MGKCFVDPNALLAVAKMLKSMANGDTICVGKEKPTFNTKPCGCNRTTTQPRDEFGRFTKANRCGDFGGFAVRFERPSFTTGPLCPPKPRWNVCECEPREDENKVFGLSVRVDEPTPDMFCTRARFIDARRKWDNLVDAVEAVDWQNKSNTAPLHKVNCIRKRIQDGPVFNRQLIGETHWF